MCWAATNEIGSIQGQAQFSTNTDTVNATSLQQETDYLPQSAAIHNVRVIFTLLEGYYDCLGLPCLRPGAVARSSSSVR